MTACKNTPSIVAILRKIKCLLGLHDWLYNDSIIKQGTVRVCRRCLKSEAVRV